jgi:DNA-binding XRE family transcriptional regulator
MAAWRHAKEKEMTIADAHVKAARLLLGWSQVKVAAQTGVSATTIGKLESGKQRPAMLDLSVAKCMSGSPLETFSSSDLPGGFKRGLSICAKHRAVFDCLFDPCKLWPVFVARR